MSDKTAHPGRVALLTAGIPGVALLAGAVLWQAWSPRLPARIAVHWGLHGPDRAASTDVFALVTLGIGLALTIGGLCLALIANRRGGLTRSVVGFDIGTATLPPAILIGTLNVNLDATSWTSAGGAVPLIALTLAISGAAAVAGALLLGSKAAVARDRRPVAADAPSVGLDPAQRASWLGGARNEVLLWIWVVAGIVAALLGVLGGQGTAWIPATIVALTGGLLSITIGRLRVTVNDAGVTVRTGVFGWPRRDIPIEDIDQAGATHLSMLSFGGFGHRVNPVTGSTAYKIRSGPALTVDLRSGRTVYMSVDAPEQAAGLLNDLIRRGQPQHG